MSISRKRLRPLDPAEERSVTTSSWVRLSYLDDERSYCLSWPDSPLTRFLSASTSYAATHIYHSQTETELSARMGLSGGSGGAAATGRKPVPVPPVFRASEILSSSASTAPTGSISNNNSSEGASAAPDTIAHLLYAYHDQGPPITTVAGQVADPHPLAPPRPHTTTEDSILSLTSAQVQDAAAAGLLSSSCAATGATPNPEDAAKRRQLEVLVTGFEWRAFQESQRSGAALQRLLTLDAAVPLLPPPPAPANNSNNSGVTTATPTDHDEATRRTIYELWLRWRLHSAGRLTPQEVALCADAGRTPPASVEGSLPACAWGTPLLCGAYLYGMQNDYFLNPLVAPGTAALQQQQQQLQNGASASPTSDAAGAAAAAALAGRLGDVEMSATDANGFMTRRRGCYNFLRWRIERYLPRLRAASGADGGGSATGTTSDEAGLAVRSNSNAPLGAPQIDTLVRRVVLSEPVLDVEMDEQRDTVQALAWTDLVDECQSWSTWLSKV